MMNQTLWIVEDPYADYEQFESAAVWAHSAEHTIEIVKAANGLDVFKGDGEYIRLAHGQAKRLVAHLAPTFGVAHVTFVGA